MTKTTILERINALRPNTYETQLGDYLKSLEMRIKTELFGQSDPIFDPASLILGETDFEIYELYLFSVIDFLNGEFGKYENSSAAFNKAYSYLLKKAIEQRDSPERRLKIWN